MPQPFPDLGEWRQTRDALHAYSRVLGAFRRQLVPPHPRWWHASLQVATQGLSTGPISVPGESPVEALALTLNLRRSRLTLEVDGEGRHELALLAAPSALELGEQALSWLRELGLELEPDSSLWRDAGPRSYDPEAANRYLRALLEVARVFSTVRESLAGKTGPVQLWPHHFDLSFEWFGSRQVEWEEEGQSKVSPTQIGFGFSTGDVSHPEAYFYANPWPFEDLFLEGALPDGARWQTAGWQGALLPYPHVRRRGPDLLRAFLRTVYEVTAPRLS